MARYSREVIVTEKIDGTNAQVFIGEDGEFLTGSRKRWITPSDDNYGFSNWANEHKDELLKLGPGRHFGEWWGSKIQRGYGLTNGEKRFSLFNTTRWKSESSVVSVDCNSDWFCKREEVPSCVEIVPVLWIGLFDDLDTDYILDELVNNGSVAAPNFVNPEGIVIYHIASNAAFKKTIKNDSVPKTMVYARTQ